jgi:hypothetical protein
MLRCMRWQSIFSTGDSSLARSVVAFVFAPPLASYVFAALAIATLAVRDTAPLDQALAGIVLAPIVITVFGGALFAYIGMAAVGLPAWLVLRFTNCEASLSYLLAGAVGGARLGPEMSLPPVIRENTALNGALAGVTLMLVFWWIARRPRREPT